MTESGNSKNIFVRMFERIVVDRPARQGALAIGATWAALLAVLAQDVDDLAGAVLAGLLGLAPIILGFAAASRCRPLAQRTFAERGRLAGLTVAIGAALGAANLCSNYLIAMIHPSIREMLIERFVRVKTWGAMTDTPVTEEIAFRLVFLSCAAWVTSRFVKRPGGAFVIALWVSSFVFGFLHVLRPLPLDLNLAFAYGTAVVLKSGLAGVALGWVFWRWGLPYSMLCHSVTNGAHRLLEPLLF